MIDKYFLKTYDEPKKEVNRMKKTVFISHITEEAELARILKEEIIRRTAGFVDVFVSSDGASIEAGKEWLESIKNGIHNADLMIALCSQESTARSWVNFEIGAGWARNVHVIPACHTNIIPSQLTHPIAMLQGITLGRKEGLESLFKKVAEVVGGNVEQISSGDYSEVLNKIAIFEIEYGFDKQAKQYLSILIDYLPEVKNILREASIGNVYEIYLNDTKLTMLEKTVDKLKDLQVLSIAKIGGASLFKPADGFKQKTEIILLERFAEIDVSKIF